MRCRSLPFVVAYLRNDSDGCCELSADGQVKCLVQEAYLAGQTGECGGHVAGAIDTVDNDIASDIPHCSRIRMYLRHIILELQSKRIETCDDGTRGSCTDVVSSILGYGTGRTPRIGQIDAMTSRASAETHVIEAVLARHHEYKPLEAAGSPHSSRSCTSIALALDINEAYTSTNGACAHARRWTFYAIGVVDAPAAPKHGTDEAPSYTGMQTACRLSMTSYPKVHCSHMPFTHPHCRHVQPAAPASCTAHQSGARRRPATKVGRGKGSVTALP